MYIYTHIHTLIIITMIIIIIIVFVLALGTGVVVVIVIVTAGGHRVQEGRGTRGAAAPRGGRVIISIAINIINIVNY